MSAKSRNTHPGQAQGSARKHTSRRQKRLQAIAAPLQAKYRARNLSQARQDKTACEIAIQGFPGGLQEVFGDETMKVYPHLAKYFGSVEPRSLDCIRVDSDLNMVSFERGVLSELLSRGYGLEELEVEFLNEEEAKWGRSVWYKEHLTYDNPPQDIRDGFPKAGPLALSYLIAHFKTEHAGDQQFTLLSGQMVTAEIVGQRPRILLHKSIVFRKAVLSPPAKELAKAA